MSDNDAKKYFGMYKTDGKKILNATDMDTVSLFESSDATILPKITYDKKITTIDEVVDNSSGNTMSVNQPSPSSVQPSAPYINNGQANTPYSIYKNVAEALAGIFGTAILPYNSENPIAIENIAEGLMIGNMVSKKFGKNKTQKALITAICMAGGVAIKTVIDKKKKP